MNVIFLSDVLRVARKGQVKMVSDGYARNYLFPHKLAVPATEESLQMLKESRDHEAELQKKKHDQLTAALGDLEKRPLSLTEKASAQGKLFGSITAQDISRALSDRIGMRIDPTSVKLDRPIATVGDHTIPLQLPEGNTIAFQLTVIRET